MTSIYDLYQTDLEKEVEGFWYSITPDVSFLLARAGGANTKFTQALEKKTRPHRQRGGAFSDDNVTDVELAMSVMKEAFAETVILDWKGVTDVTGKKVAYSSASAIKLFNDLPDLFTELRDAAAKQANFRMEEIEEDIKN